MAPRSYRTKANRGSRQAGALAHTGAEAGDDWRSAREVWRRVTYSEAMGHLRTLKLVNFLVGAYTFVLGLLFLVMFVLPGLWAWWDGETPGLIFVAAGILVFLLLGGFGVAHIVVGYLVGSGRGRVAQSLLASLQLMSFPVGTAYAVYALYVCWVDAESSHRFEAAIKPPIS